jgi:DNA-binding transcriptional LysR family regulator
MNLTTLDLNLLLVFDAIHAAGSVTGAAERLDMRQPAVSAALARLRIALDDELFVRAAGAMQPTAKALRIAPGITAAIAGLSQALADAIPFAPAQSERSFIIASTDYTTLVLLPSLLAAIREEAPRVALRVIGYDKDDVPGLIDRGEIDLALGVFRQPPERAVRQRLCDERFVGICRSGHPRLIDGAMRLADYIEAEHALVSVRRDMRGEIDALLAARGLQRRIVLALPHMLALPGVVRATDLVVAVPERAARQIADASLTVFELPFRHPAWNIEMLWNVGMRSDPASLWIRSAVVRIARGLGNTPGGQ